MKQTLPPFSFVRGTQERKVENAPEQFRRRPDFSQMLRCQVLVEVTYLFKPKVARGYLVTHSTLLI